MPADGRVHGRVLAALDISQPMLLSHFTQERRWSSLESILEVTVTWEPLDFMSRAPGSIELMEVSILERPAAETFETPLDQQGRSDVYRWCFERGPLPQK